MDHTDVFINGADGVNTYRIPALIVAPGGTLLATITLASPCGSVQGDVLLLTSSTSEGPVVAVSGEARWARLVTADGLWALDCAVAVDAEGATAGLLIAGTQAGPNGGALLYKGGRLPAVELALR